MTPTWFEHATFWSGVRRATVAPRSPAGWPFKNRVYELFKRAARHYTRCCIDSLGLVNRITKSSLSWRLRSSAVTVSPERSRWSFTAFSSVTLLRRSVNTGTGSSSFCSVVSVFPQHKYGTYHCWPCCCFWIRACATRRLLCAHAHRRTEAGVSDVSPLSGLKWAVSLIPIFYNLSRSWSSSLVLLPSLVALSVLSVSAFGPFSWPVFPFVCFIA